MACVVSSFHALVFSCIYRSRLISDLYGWFKCGLPVVPLALGWFRLLWETWIDYTLHRLSVIGGTVIGGTDSLYTTPIPFVIICFSSSVYYTMYWKFIASLTAAEYKFQTVNLAS
jgi:hypothetical protein